MPENPPAPGRGDEYRLSMRPYVLNGLGSADSTEDGPSVRGALAAIRRHLWIVVLFATIGVGLTAWVLTRSERLWVSRATIQLPEKSAAPSGIAATLTASLGGTSGSVNSQVEVIRSRLLMSKVVDSLGIRLLREVPAIPRNKMRPVGWLDQIKIDPSLQSGTVDFSFRSDGVTVRYDGDVVNAAYGEVVAFPGLNFVVPFEPQRVNWRGKYASIGDIQLTIVDSIGAVYAVMEETQPVVRDGTNLIDIVATGYDYYITEKVANVAAHFYREHTISKTRDTMRKQQTYFTEQLDVAEASLDSVQRDLTDYRQRERIFFSRDEAILKSTAMSDLKMRQADLEARTRVLQETIARYKAAGPEEQDRALLTMMVQPGVADNDLITAQYQTLKGYEGVRDSLTTGNAAIAVTARDVQDIDAVIARSKTNLVTLIEGTLRGLVAQKETQGLIEVGVDSAFEHLARAEPEEARLNLRMGAIGDAVVELRGKSVNAGSAQAGLVEEVTVLDPALLGDPTGTGPVRSLILGLVLGTLIGSAAAILIDSANRSIRQREEVEKVLRIPGLGVIPAVRKSAPAIGRLKLSAGRANGHSRNGAPSELITTTAVNSVGAESYRSVRTNLAYTVAMEGTQSIMVTSPSANEGKTMTAANLATTFAQQGRRVLLIDADLRRARLHNIFSLPQKPGLADVLSNASDRAAAIHQTEVAHLHLMPAGGNLSISAADLLSGDAVRRLLKEVSADYDIIIIDSPPVLLTADAPILATQVDGVLLVVRAGQTERETAQYAVQQLAAVGARLLGAVLNDPDSLMTGQAAYTAGSYTNT